MAKAETRITAGEQATAVTITVRFLLNLQRARAVAGAGPPIPLIPSGRGRDGSG